MPTVVSVENLGKRYQLGEINREFLYQELQSWWAKVRGKEDPNSPIHQGGPGQNEGESFWALKDVSFQVERGDVIGIIGKNGSGKSTLLKILSEITTPSTGQVRIKGRVASLLEVGTGFHQDLTGKENVFLNGSILGMSRREIESKYDEIVEFSGVGKFMDTPVKRYSSGMKLRLAFAVAAHLDPEILILDEVLAVGDSDFQQKCLGRMGEVAASGRTILFVSHNLAAVQALCNRGIVLNHGRMVFSGTADEAISHYLHVAHPASRALEERTDRKGTGDARFVGVQLREPNGQMAGLVRAGQDIDFVFHIKNYGVAPLTNLRVTFNIKSEMDIQLCKQDSSDSLDRFDCPPGLTTISCRLRHVPLIESTYRIVIGLTDPEGVMLDLVDDAFEFNVGGSEFFGGKKLSQNKRFAFLVKGDWLLPEVNRA